MVDPRPLALTKALLIWDDASKFQGVMSSLLSPGEKHPANLVNQTGSSPFVLICEHASNVIPALLSDLGLSDADRRRHIAWDIGAAGVSLELSRLLDAPLIMQRYSRLVYDCNRPPESDGAMPEISEVFTVPGNAKLSAADKLKRINDIYRPYLAAVNEFLDARAAGGQRAIPISIHSFTRVYKGKERSVELGLLFDRDDWLAQKIASEFPGHDTRLNEPYGPKDGVIHLMNVIAAPRGLKHLMIEVRNDLIEHEDGQKAWADRLARALKMAV
jgi:predicted N-formylglutamate amidohydrolase